MPTLVATGQITIQDVMDGLYARLSNEAATVPADTDGGNADLTGCVTTMSIFLGALDVSAEWTVTAQPSNGVTGALAGKTYTVTGITSDSGYVDLIASKPGQVDITARFTIAKARRGFSGPAIDVVASRAGISFVDNFMNPPLQDIGFTLIRNNAADKAGWYATDNVTPVTDDGMLTALGAAFGGVTGIGDNCYLHITDFGADNQVALTCIVGSLVHVKVIPRLDRATAEPFADVTGNNTAAAIVGQSDWATYYTINPFTMANKTQHLDNATGFLTDLDRITSRPITKLKRADGATDVTEAAIVTVLGTAAAIAGQGSLATKSQASWLTDVANRPPVDEVYHDFAFASIAAAQAAGHQISGSVSCSIEVTSSSPGGAALVLGDGVTALSNQWFAPEFIPYNGNDLYEVVFDVEIMTSDATANFYAGVEARDRAGNNLGLSYNYVAAVGKLQNSNLGRRLFKGYLTGFTSGTTSGEGTTPETAKGLPDGSAFAFGFGGTVRFRPMVFCNYNNRPGQVKLHAVRVTRIPAKLAVQDEIAFGGFYLKEATGGTVASLANFKTGLGTAAAIAGQGALATANAVNLASQVSGTLGTANAAAGLLNSNISIAANGALSGAGGGSVTIGGLGYTGALNATYGARAGTNIYRTDGATVMSQAELRTAEGTAAAISGQGTLATKNLITPSLTNIGSTSNVILDPSFADLGYWSLSSPNPGAAVSISTDSAAVAALGSTRVLKFTCQGGALAGAAYPLAQANTNWTPVSGGQNYFVQVAYYCSDAFTVGLCVFQLRCLKSDGSIAYPSKAIHGALATDAAGVVSGIVTLPANTVAIQPNIQMAFAAGNTPAGTVYYAKPIVQPVSAFGGGIVRADGLTQVTDSAAITALGTAAAIAGQGALATANAVNLASQVSGTLGAANAAAGLLNSNISIAANGALSGAGGGSVTIGGLGYTGALNATFGARVGVNLRNSADTAYLGDADVVTASGTAAAIVGQGAGATANTLAQLDATAASQLAALANVSKQTAAYGETIKRRLAAGAAVALDAIVNCNGGGLSGSIRARIDARPYGGTWSAVATGAGSSTGPGEPGGDSVVGTFTNSTGIEQLFEFRVMDQRTPSGAGGTIIYPQSYVAG